MHSTWQDWLSRLSIATLYVLLGREKALLNSWLTFLKKKWEGGTHVVHDRNRKPNNVEKKNTSTILEWSLRNCRSCDDVT